MKRRNFLSAAAGSAAAILSAATSSVRAVASPILADATAGNSPAKLSDRRGATVLIVIPPENWAPKSWREVPFAEFREDSVEPLRNCYTVIGTFGNISLGAARKVAKENNQAQMLKGVKYWAIVAATDGRLRKGGDV